MTGPELRRLREAAGWTQAELGRRIGLREQSAKGIVSRMESGGRRISPREALAIRVILAGGEIEQIDEL